MIKKILLISFCLFVSYNLLVFLTDEDPEYFPSYTSDNINKAENYIYANQNYTTIIVGSSLSAKIRLNNSYNLSFIGEGPFTGLELIRKNEKLPKIIIIETNYLVRAANVKFTESILTEPIKTLKYFFPAFLEKNQPTFKFLNAIFSENDTARILTNQKRIWEIKKSEYLQLYPEAKIKKTAIDFNETINYLKNKNIKVVFLTIPIDTLLRNTPRYQQELKMWHALVRKNNIPWIKAENYFRTIDGEHLLINENIVFSKFLQRKLEN